MLASADSLVPGNSVAGKTPSQTVPDEDPEPEGARELTTLGFRPALPAFSVGSIDMP